MTAVKRGFQPKHSHETVVFVQCFGPCGGGLKLLGSLSLVVVFRLRAIVDEGHMHLHVYIYIYKCTHIQNLYKYVQM